MGHSKTDGGCTFLPVLDSSGSPIATLTLRTSPSALLGYVSITRARLHQFLALLSSLTITILPTCMLWRGLVHLDLSCRLWRNSFFQRVQNSHDKCWTLLHCFLEYRSSLWKTPGGGRTGFVFIVRIWFGDSGDGDFGSLRLSTVSGRLFTIALVSQISVWKDSPSRELAPFSRRADITLRMVLAMALKALCLVPSRHIPF